MLLRNDLHKYITKSTRQLVSCYYTSCGTVHHPWHGRAVLTSVCKLCVHVATALTLCQERAGLW